MDFLNSNGSIHLHVNYHLNIFIQKFILLRFLIHTLYQEIVSFKIWREQASIIADVIFWQVAFNEKAAIELLDLEVNERTKEKVVQYFRYVYNIEIYSLKNSYLNELS
jgi:hypothetical protein